MAKQLRVRGAGDLSDVAARAGRRLPKRLHKDVALWVGAVEKLEHPKLALQVDDRALKRSEKRLRAYLDGQNPGAVRRGEILDLVAKVALVIWIVGLGLFFFLLWRGDLT
ncbi:MAG: hypothetical protein OIF48_18315 [Silicimonas sp.]|nr:hypothetical protein [Silicimonas sp.]